MYNVKLTKIISDHSILRTNEVEGTAEYLPVVGYPFEMTSSSLSEDKNYRDITTSYVQSIEMVDGKYVMKTMNSVYELEVITDFAEGD